MSNISDKTREYLQMLEKGFDKDNFYIFVKDLLNLTNEDIKNENEKKPTTEQYSNYIETSQLYAKYIDNKRNAIGVLIIRLKDNKHPANARTLQRNYIAHLMDVYGLNASITAIYSVNDSSWRLSFVKQELTVNVGKLQTKVTPAKRYSYLFGEDEPNHTAKKQLLELLENNDKQYSLEEIEEKFSVEKVTKEFFENYKENYLKLKEKLENNKEFIEQSQKWGFTSEEFTKKLMGQIVFLYFLQKKGWLGVKLVPQKLSLEEYNEFYNKADLQGKKILDKYYTNINGGKRISITLLENVKANEKEIEMLSDMFVDSKYDEDWGTGEKRFIRRIYENCINRQKNFFEDYLEPFFYVGLNHKRKNQYFGVFNCKIPFLNGGLFEPLDNYDWELADFEIDNSIFSNEEKTGILDFFDTYNFTINEEEPLEKDVAVDPEMLGKIFENLLDVKDRKSKGAFYTPREIVHYMCQESLANYLVNKTGVDYNEIKEFIQYGEIIRDEDLKSATNENHLIGDSIYKKIVDVDKALKNIKIADPAVGSGAFPLGMLNEIVKLRDILTSYMIIYKKNGNFQSEDVTIERIINNRALYTLKWNAIKNSIYAVDIENSAIDITKLRLWLSIVVDQVEVPKTGPEPLPNLDFKIMQGNSLIDEYRGIKLIDKNIIEEFKRRLNGTAKQLKMFKDDYVNVQLDLLSNENEKKSVVKDLIELKSQLYGENDSENKKALLEKIDKRRKELFTINFKYNKEVQDELIAIDNSHNKPYFAWELEFIEVFMENDGFDIVIGNPPYLESRNPDFTEEMKNAIQNVIIKKYGKDNCFPKGTDLLVYFFELSYCLLKNGGINTLITQNAWLDTEYGIKFQKFLMKNLNVLAVIDSDYKYFDTADINTVITILNKSETVNSPISYFKVHTKNFNKCNILCDGAFNKDEIEVKKFNLNDLALKKLKWGFLFNADTTLLKVLNVLYEKGNLAEEKDISIGQGLNLTKEYFVDGNIKGLFENDALIPIYNVSDNGSLVWEEATTYIVDNGKNKKHYDDIKEFDRTKTTKISPKIILPRGVGNRHYASMNELNGFSSSYVDVYITKEDEHLKLCVWLFCNSSLFWLIRETAGRTNLGGGMLKAEAVDIKNIPIFLNFDNVEEIRKIYNDSRKKVVGDVEQEIEKEYHKRIDKIVFDYLNIEGKDREHIVNTLKRKVLGRYKKMLK